MTETHPAIRALRLASVCVLTSALIACTSSRGQGPANVEIRGSDPNAALDRTGTNTLNNDVVRGADTNGIITYDGYQTVQARSGDTVGSVASRIGLSATQLGAYNGLPATHGLQEGDELALPPRPGGYGAAGPQTAVSNPAQPAQAQAPVVRTLPPNPSTAGIPEAPSTDVASASTTPGTWSPDLAEAAIARSSGLNEDGTIGLPPSTAAPIPPEPEARPELASPDLSQYQTDESAGAVIPRPRSAPVEDQRVASASPDEIGVKLRRPVDGPVAVGFNKGVGPTRNDGVDFAAPAGAKVIAAADGEVALVSESLGGLGTIVLIRHPNELLTVYGRIDGVMVTKGDIVSSGQQIGVVSNAAAPAEPRMHFEVRRGAESLDPMQFL